MIEVLSHFAGHWFTHLLGLGGMFGGVIVAFGVWCWHWAILERRRAIANSVLLAMVGAAFILPIFLLPAWSRAQLVHIVVGALIFYLPLRAATPKATQ